MNESKTGNIYPENGSVVIIDDKIEEALPLMKVLSKLDIPFKYFSGKFDELPESPLNNVRILFLDIELEGMEGIVEDKTKLSTLANVIDNIISEKCQPYIIIAWTKYKELVNELKNYMQNKKKKPLFTSAIDKADCKEKDNSESFNLNAITTEINNKLKNFGIFVYFLLWQNLVNKAAGIVINDIASVYDYDTDWNQKLIRVLDLIAKAYAGKQASNNTIEKEKYSMSGFNGLFMDILENLIINNETTYLNENPDKIQISLTDEDMVKGELNRRLLISFEKNEQPIPGNIYDIESKEDKKKEFLSGIYNGKFDEYQNKNDVINKSNLIELEVSPVCDYAQNKWKKSRILPGIKIPQSFENKIKKADYIYKSPLFLLNNEPVYFVFDIRYLTSVEINNLENKESLMRMRKELLNDIQTKISAHINRLGITSL